ncbi:MAG: multicopper oxidase family protein [Alphaproteobacteria bacterium]|nr:multicopper oxidase family protein [Alphaproteobacteria bacterium]
MSSAIWVSRRALLRVGGTIAIGTAWPFGSTLKAAPDTIEKRFTAGPGRVALAGADYPETAVWCYNGKVPGPEIRLRQGQRVRVVVENRLSEDTTIHWHGLRVPNAMDGAPYVTQPPIQPGRSFTYEFTVPDAGTYWYHPHAHSAEQVGRGLMGAFIVEEREPLPVDRDVVWVLGDFRLKQDASIAGGFDNPMEMSMAGRIGNTVTINGSVPDRFKVRSGERIRLRLISAAPARIYGLEFRGHRPLVVSFDGQPLEPHAPEGGRVVLGPAMRVDLVVDMNGKPGSTAPVIDSFYEGLAYKLVDIAYTNETPVRTSALSAPAQLPRNTMPEPDLANADRHDVTLTGGMMSGMGMGGGMGGMMGGGSMWAINGVAVMHDDMRHMKPILTLMRGKSYILAIDNRTAWYHPIHLHGHSFRVITRNGKPTRYREWRDTVLMPPRERAEIAFVADNPGDWMFHCHILDHQEGGMMSVIRIA